MYRDKNRILAIGFFCCVSAVLTACSGTQTQTEIYNSEVEDSEAVFVETEEGDFVETEEIFEETEAVKELTEEEKLEIKYENFDYESYVQGDISGWTKQDYKTVQDAVEELMSTEFYQIWYAEDGDLIDESQQYEADKFTMFGREYGILWCDWGAEETLFGYYFLDDPEEVYTARIIHGNLYNEIGVYDLFELYLESSQAYYSNYTNDKRMACDEELNAYYDMIHQQELAAASVYTKEEVYARAQQDLKNSIYGEMNIFDMIGSMAAITWNFESSDSIYYIYDSANRVHGLEFTVRLSEYMGLGDSISQRMYMEYREDESGGLTLITTNRVQ